MSYPIQPAKIQAPALRDETLARTRLLDWLEVKIHSRVVFVIADAGYGKTTLLADFSRRSRLRTIWYRIDEQDRDWVGFLSHLVAAGREFDPEFAPRTAAILRSLEPGGPTREDAIEMFLRELPAITGDGAALIFDDFHLADEAADIRLIAREIVAHGPERLSVVFASRRAPAVPVAKLRSLGELAELGIADLRFSNGEVEQLFRETYRRTLEPDVLAELTSRTEGWAASLTLVQAALRERSPAETRTFIRGLSGARDELHDYLAEEVVGDLSEMHQRFLMRTSILQRVTPELAQVATGMSAIEVQSMISEAERLGMLGRRANRRSSAQGYHPLVREFLEARLRAVIGDAGLDELHKAVATWADGTDWATAAHHYSAASCWRQLQSVIEGHLELIVASGAFAVAAKYSSLIRAPTPSAALEVVASRQASVEGDTNRVTRHAERAVELDPDNDVVIGTLVSAKLLVADFEGAMSVARDWATRARSPLMREIANATTLLIEASLFADLRHCARQFEDLAALCRRDGLLHFEGVSWLNLANVYRAQSLLDRAHQAAGNAVEALSASSSGNELASARLVQASVSALRGDLPAARDLYAELAKGPMAGIQREFLVEVADTEAMLGSAVLAARSMEQRGQYSSRLTEDTEQIVEAILAARHGDFSAAREAALALPTGNPSPNAGHQSRVLATQALMMALAGDPNARERSESATQLADRQGASGWGELANLAQAASTGQFSRAIVAIRPDDRWVLSAGAELSTTRLDELSSDAEKAVIEEAGLRPERWLPALRREMRSGSRSNRVRAGRILDVVGDETDVIALRALARELKASGADRRLGRGLARRLAPQVFIEDLGRLRIFVGPVEVGSHEVRRKVLSLLCFLLTRPRFAATREEVMDRMWPDIDPSAALNSLNQSVYFLRRVFEPEYSEDTTAGYVQQGSDILWLDDELVQSRSRVCSALISDYQRTPSFEVAEALSRNYTGPFALDFLYEDWSLDFREWLSVSYLQVIETEVRSCTARLRFDDGVLLARRALRLEPRTDEVEMSLLRLLKSAGAHSAAAEQYARYSAFLRRDLGVEPPPMDAV